MIGYPTDVGADGGQFGVKTKGNSIGFNLEWIATDSLCFALDYHSSTAKSGKNSPYGTNAVLGGVGFYPWNDSGRLFAGFPGTDHGNTGECPGPEPDAYGWCQLQKQLHES